MKLTRKKAIELCIELWKWCARTGKDKDEWPKWEKYGEITCDCWFCEYDEQQKRRYGVKKECTFCPLVKKLGLHCGKTFFEKWAGANPLPRTNKKYAKLFLNQIKSIK